MAQLLLERHSTDAHLGGSGRHMCRCKQIKGGEPYATKISPSHSELQEITLQAKIAKSNLRRQYEFNYLDMVKEFGKESAERFFLAISAAPKKKVKEADNSANTEG